MSVVEEDGDEIFIPIADVVHCGLALQPDRGFWRCPKCRTSFGQVVDAKAIFEARKRGNSFGRYVNEQIASARTSQHHLPAASARTTGEDK